MLSKRDKLVQKIIKLGYSWAEAEQITEDFLKEGGLYCLNKYGDSFSMFSSKKNIADCIFECGLM